MPPKELLAKRNPKIPDEKSNKGIRFFNKATLKLNNELSEKLGLGPVDKNYVVSLTKDTRSDEELKQYFLKQGIPPDKIYDYCKKFKKIKNMNSKIINEIIEQPIELPTIPEGQETEDQHEVPYHLSKKTRMGLMFTQAQLDSCYEKYLKIAGGVFRVCR